MNPIQRLHTRRLNRLVAQRQRFYDDAPDAQRIADWQLEQLNELWPSIVRDVPYYQNLHKERGLAKRFADLDAFQQAVPITDRETVQTRGAHMRIPSPPPGGWSTTGGSTSQPVQLPVWSSERTIASANTWFGRRMLGIDPADRLFLLWGHSHLLGRGLRGRVNAMRRGVKDRLRGYRRWSAYDLTAERMTDAAEAMRRFRPAYVIGYARALDRLARINALRAEPLRGLKLKAVIATAESFPRPDSRGCIERVFGCPVAMEYGAVETGPLAYQAGPNGFFAFWRDFLFETLPSSHVPDARELLVTCLYPRCFPLIRYRLGDLVRVDADAPSIGLSGFRDVLGKSNDMLELSDGTPIHSSAITQAVKGSDAITGYQVVKRADGTLVLRFQSAAPLSAEVQADVRRRLKAMHGAFASMELERVDRLDHTIAGKSRMIVQES